MFPRNGTHDLSAAQVTISRTDFTRLLMQEATAQQLMASGNMQVQGNAILMVAMFGALDPVDPQFNIVTP